MPLAKQFKKWVHGGSICHVVTIQLTIQLTNVSHYDVTLTNLEIYFTHILLHIMASAALLPILQHLLYFFLLSSSVLQGQLTNWCHLDAIMCWNLPQRDKWFRSPRF